MRSPRPDDLTEGALELVSGRSLACLADDCAPRKLDCADLFPTKSSSKGPARTDRVSLQQSSEQLGLGHESGSLIEPC